MNNRNLSAEIIEIITEVKSLNHGEARNRIDSFALQTVQDVIRYFFYAVKATKDSHLHYEKFFNQQGYDIPIKNLGYVLSFEKQKRTGYIQLFRNGVLLADSRWFNEVKLTPRKNLQNNTEAIVDNYKKPKPKTPVKPYIVASQTSDFAIIPLDIPDTFNPINSDSISNFPINYPSVKTNVEKTRLSKNDFTYNSSKPIPLKNNKRTMVNNLNETERQFKPFNYIYPTIDSTIDPTIYPTPQISQAPQIDSTFPGPAIFPNSADDVFDCLNDPYFENNQTLEQPVIAIASQEPEIITEQSQQVNTMQEIDKAQEVDDDLFLYFESSLLNSNQFQTNNLSNHPNAFFTAEKEKNNLSQQFAEREKVNFLSKKPNG